MEIKNLLILILIMIGISELIVGIIFYIRERKFKMTGIKTQAKIVELKQVGRKYRLKVEYQTNDGLVEKKNISSSSKIFYPFEEGDVVGIYYDENNVRRYRFEKDRIWSVLTAIMFVFAILSFLNCVIFFFVL